MDLTKDLDLQKDAQKSLLQNGTKFLLYGWLCFSKEYTSFEGKILFFLLMHFPFPVLKEAVFFSRDFIKYVNK